MASYPLASQRKDEQGMGNIGGLLTAQSFLSHDRPKLACVLNIADPCYNIAGAATAYATFFGILATGMFAFLGFLFARATQPSVKFNFGRLRPLLIAFFTLSLTTYLYATMSGELSPNRLAAENDIAAGIAAVSVVQVFTALAHLLAEIGTGPSERDSPYWQAQRVVLGMTAAVVVLVALFVIVSMNGAAQALEQRDVYKGQWLWVTLWSMLITGLPPLAIFRQWRQIATANQAAGLGRDGVPTNAEDSKVPALQLYGVLAITLVGGIAFSVFAALAPDYPSRTFWTGSFVAIAVGAAFSIQLIDSAILTMLLPRKPDDGTSPTNGIGSTADADPNQTTPTPQPATTHPEPAPPPAPTPASPRATSESQAPPARRTSQKRPPRAMPTDAPERRPTAGEATHQPPKPPERSR